MATVSGLPDDAARLRAVQRELRSLEAKYSTFTPACSKAREEIARLDRESHEQAQADRRAAWDRARELLRQGYLSDPELLDQRHDDERTPRPFTKLVWWGPSNSGLQKAQDHPGMAARGSAPIHLENAAAALEAMEWYERFAHQGLSDDQMGQLTAKLEGAIAAGTHVRGHWEMRIARPAGWLPPRRPRALDVRPLLPSPPQKGDFVSDFLAGLDEIGPNGTPALSELGRFSEDEYTAIAFDNLRRMMERKRVDPAAFPVDVAEQMLAHVRRVLSDGRRVDVESTRTGPDEVIVPSPAAIPPRQSPPSNECVDEYHLELLRILEKRHPRLLTALDLAGEGTVRGRATVGRLLRELGAAEYIHRPKGKRKGWALTPKGRTLLEQQRGTTPR